MTRLRERLFNRIQKSSEAANNQRGQIIVEYILLMVVLIAVFSAIIDVLKEQGVATKFTQDPWEKMSGMVQCGSWTACGVEKPTSGIHPNTSGRVLTLDPKQAL